MNFGITHLSWHKTLRLLLAGTVAFSFSGCEDDDDPVPQDDGFAVTQLLSEYERTIIQPNIDELVVELERLNNRISTLTSNPDQSALNAARGQWTFGALAYAHCQSFNFGPGESTFGSFTENVATFPASEDKIRDFIAEEDTSLANFDRDARGIYALEYLLFQENALTDIEAPAYAAYTRSVARRLLEQAEELDSDWTGYAAGFTSDDGTEVSSSVTLLYNEWIKGYEVIKNFKVGIPAGLRGGQTEAAPEQVAGLYSGKSKAIIEAQLKHIEAMYFGGLLDSDPSAIGFDDYLLTTVGGRDVLDQTTAQWQTIWDAFDALPDQSFDQLVVNEADHVEVFYTALSQHTRFFKSELSSRLGLTITFDSGDGD